MRKYTEEQRARNRLRSKRWYLKNKERAKKNFEKWYAINGQTVRDRAADWVKRNPERFAKNQETWRKKFSAKRVAEARKRRIETLKAKPLWAIDFFMDEAYKLADIRTKATGIKWQVDHIVPLRSKKVCGLHVHNNLRVIPAIENNRKGNRFWPDMA